MLDRKFGATKLISLFIYIYRTSSIDTTKINHQMEVEVLRISCRDKHDPRFYPAKYGFAQVSLTFYVLTAIVPRSSVRRECSAFRRSNSASHRVASRRVEWKLQTFRSISMDYGIPGVFLQCDHVNCNDY